MKLNILFFLLAALGGMTVFTLKSLASDDAIDKNRRSPFLGVQTTDATPINIQIGDSEYSIPANYFDFQPDPRCNARSALFRVLFPGVEARSKDNQELFNVVGDKRTAGNVLLNYSRERLPGYPLEGALGRILRGRLNFFSPYEKTGAEHGLIGTFCFSAA